MKRLAIVISLLFASQTIMAQSPKAVIKGLSENDIIANTERLEKITDKVREKMPEMCYLAEAALLNMHDQVGTNKLAGYEILSGHIDAIRSSENIEKTFSGLDTSLEEVITTIEQESFDYLMTLNSERNYVLYISWAKRGNHPQLANIESRLEHLRYKNTLAGSSVEDCDFFLSNYPKSKYLQEISEHRTTLLYDEAMRSNDEELIAHFIESYANYHNIEQAKQHLMALRYDRIFNAKVTSLKQMKWFVEQYPSHPNLGAIKQQMADIEFESVPSTCDSLIEFISYYGDVEQRAEAQRRLHLARVVEQGNVRDLVEYVRGYGYDIFYSMMIRNIYKHCKRYIVTPDITDVTLLRFATEDGHIGYMDLDGNVVIEPIYDARTVDFGIGNYNNTMLSEFTSRRNYVALSLNGCWGVINDKGESIIEHKYQAITIFNNQIYAVPDILAGESANFDVIAYVCDVYSPNGKLVARSETTEWDDVLPYRAFVGNDGIRRGTYISPKYCYDMRDGISQIINLEGDCYECDWKIVSGITDNIAIVEVEDNGGTKRYFANLDTRTLIQESPYSKVYPMSCGRAAVYVEGKGYGFIDENLKLTIPAQYNLDKATKFNCGLMVVRNDDNTYSLINTNGEALFTTQSIIEDISAGMGDEFNQVGLFMLSNGNIYTIIDTTGSILATVKSRFKPEVRGIEVYSSEKQRVALKFESH